MANRIPAEMKLDMSGLRKFGRRLSVRSGPVRDMFEQIGARYLGFLRRRYVRNSRGGGDWEPLAPSTIKQRRGSKRRKTRSPRARTKTTTRGSATKVAILRDTGTLQRALTVGASGNDFTLMRNGIRVGFADVPHPNGDDVTIAQLATIHDEGKGVPERQILVEPDAATLHAMQRIVNTGLRRIEAGIGDRRG